MNSSLSENDQKKLANVRDAVNKVNKEVCGLIKRLYGDTPEAERRIRDMKEEILTDYPHACDFAKAQYELEAIAIALRRIENS